MEQEAAAVVAQAFYLVCPGTNRRLVSCGGISETHEQTLWKGCWSVQTRNTHTGACRFET